MQFLVKLYIQECKIIESKQLLCGDNQKVFIFVLFEVIFFFKLQQGHYQFLKIDPPIFYLLSIKNVSQFSTLILNICSG